MPYLAPQIGSTFIAVIILGAALLIFSVGHDGPGFAGPAPAAKAPAKKATPANNSVEARIKSLHDALKITAAKSRNGKPSPM